MLTNMPWFIVKVPSPAKLPDRLVILLDVDRLLSSQDTAALNAAASVEKPKASAEKAKATAETDTAITVQKKKAPAAA